MKNLSALNITDLSNELLCHIIQFLPLQETLSIAMQCRKLLFAVEMYFKLCKSLNFSQGKGFDCMPSSITDEHMHSLLKKCPNLELVYGLHPLKIERRRLRKRSALTVRGIIEALCLCSKLKGVETSDLRLLEAILQYLPQIEVIGHFRNQEGIFPPHASQRLKLQPYPQIASLHLIGVEVPELTAMPHLKHLSLQCVRFTKHHPFRAFIAQNLESFVMKNCMGPTVSLRYLSLIIALSSSPSLSRLELVRVPLPGGLFQRAVEDSYKNSGFVNLKTLAISGCKGVLESDIGHLMIVSSQNLESVSIQPSLTKDSLFVSLSFAQCNFSKLKILKLGYVDKFHSINEWSEDVLLSFGMAEVPDVPSSLTDSGMKVISQLFANIHSMTIANCPHLMSLDGWSPEGIQAWKELKSLNLERCHCLRLHSFALFLAMLPKIETVLLKDMFKEPPKGCSHVGLSAGTGLGMSSAVVSDENEHIAVQGHQQDLEPQDNEELDRDLIEVDEELFLQAEDLEPPGLIREEHIPRFVGMGENGQRGVNNHIMEHGDRDVDIEDPLERFRLQNVFVHNPPENSVEENLVANHSNNNDNNRKHENGCPNDGENRPPEAKSQYDAYAIPSTSRGVDPEAKRGRHADCRKGYPCNYAHEAGMSELMQRIKKEPPSSYSSWSDNFVDDGKCLCLQPQSKSSDEESTSQKGKSMPLQTSPMCVADNAFSHSSLSSDRDSLAQEDSNVFLSPASKKLKLSNDSIPASRTLPSPTQKVADNDLNIGLPNEQDAEISESNVHSVFDPSLPSTSHEGLFSSNTNHPINYEKYERFVEFASEHQKIYEELQNELQKQKEQEKLNELEKQNEKSLQTSAGGSSTKSKEDLKKKPSSIINVTVAENDLKNTLNVEPSLPSCSGESLNFNKDSLPSTSNSDNVSTILNDKSSSDIKSNLPVVPKNEISLNKDVSKDSLSSVCSGESSGYNSQENLPSTSNGKISPNEVQDQPSDFDSHDGPLTRDMRRMLSHNHEGSPTNQNKAFTYKETKSYRYRNSDFGSKKRAYKSLTDSSDQANSPVSTHSTQPLGSSLSVRRKPSVRNCVVVSQGTQATSSDIRRSLRRQIGNTSTQNLRKNVRKLHYRERERQNVNQTVVRNTISAKQRLIRVPTKTESKPEYRDKSTSTSDPLLEDDAVQTLRLVSESLLSITIVSCGLSDIILDHCSELSHVEVQACRILKKVQLHYCPFLTRLNISQCPKLDFPDLISEALNLATTHSLLVFYEPCMQEYNYTETEQAVFSEASSANGVVLLHDFTRKVNEKTQTVCRENLMCWLDLLRVISIISKPPTKAKPKLSLLYKGNSPSGFENSEYPYGHQHIRRIHGQMECPQSLPFSASNFQILTNNPLFCAAYEWASTGEGIHNPQTYGYNTNFTLTIESLATEITEWKQSNMPWHTKITGFYIQIQETS